MMKKILLGLSFLLGFVFILWVVIVFPYPHLAVKQIEVMKQELIDGIIQREIKLRELYAEVNGREFVQTEAFKYHLQKEKEKFYKYCDNDGASEYKNEHCEVTGYTQWDILRMPTRILKYHFDGESQVFFNQIQTYMFREKFSTTHIPRPKNFVDGLLGIYPEKVTNWHERFWIEDPNETGVKPLKTQDNSLYTTKVVGYSSDYSFLNGSDRPFGYLHGQQEHRLGNGEAVMKEDLSFIKSKSIYYESISSDRGRHKNVSFNNIKIYIQKEKK